MGHTRRSKKNANTLRTLTTPFAALALAHAPAALAASRAKICLPSALYCAKISGSCSSPSAIEDVLGPPAFSGHGSNPMMRSSENAQSR